MKVTAVYVYPIKALGGISLKGAFVGSQGILFDRRFMICKIQEDNTFKKMQHSSFPHCALFEQTLLPHGFDNNPDKCTAIQVRYHPPPASTQDGSSAPVEEDNETLQVPLHPDMATLSPVTINLHKSETKAYRMGDPYDAWFTSRFGFPVALIYIGDGRRAVLGKSLLPPPTTAPTSKGWFSTLTSLVSSSSQENPWITFTDVAPLLITSETSLHNVSDRLSEGTYMDMYKFRPNIVVNGDGEDAFAEDFWGELTFTPAPREHLPPEDRVSFSSTDTAEWNEEKEEAHQERMREREETRRKLAWKVLLTGNCGRCTSLNVDYKTGKQAEGELGTVLKKLMVDRRVDKGAKWTPVFGRYGFVEGLEEGGMVGVSVGDVVEIVKRNEERSVWDWPGLGSGA
ncbi:hypothetical protein B0T16DRAFT_171543 [Cercophora newfieldiana]|uniref:MOSC domain-containing protein n=1 Tax=Cercophora newfieldiana TaxID=92897 RepID=A0AA40CRP0_9PEZI|nr:hypothetical protein B0T16DRAFT_171543 [Cercophora newfieldiana]